MSRSIISSLKNNSVLDIIYDDIVNIAQEILAGRLWNPREVELALLSCCEVSLRAFVTGLWES